MTPYWQTNGYDDRVRGVIVATPTLVDQALRSHAWFVLLLELLADDKFFVGRYFPLEKLCVAVVGDTDPDLLSPQVITVVDPFVAVAQGFAVVGFLIGRDHFR